MRIEIPTGATHIEFVTAPPREYTRFWPRGVISWLAPADIYLAEMAALGLAGSQNWSYSYMPYLRPKEIRGLPYLFEMQPETKTKAGAVVVKRDFDVLGGADDERLKRALEYHAKQPNLIGINLGCECWIGPRTWELFEYISGLGIPIFTGPVRHDPAEMMDDLAYDEFDGLVSWVNCWHRDRSGNIGDDFPEGDIWYTLADSWRWGKPLALSVQPCRREGDRDTGDPILLADPAKFRRALQCAANYADGLLLWKGEQLCEALAGDLPYEGDLAGIVEAIQTVDQTPLYRKPLTVSFNGSTSDGYNRGRVLCRCVARAGYFPQNAPAGDGLKFADLPWDAYRKNIFDRFHQGPDHCDFDGSEGEKLAEIERGIAAWICETRGTPPEPVAMREV